MSIPCFAYYCSGHGYGHATRVSAFASHLLRLPSEIRPTVYLCSSAPSHVFADSIALGARYRYAEIDPVIVQPLAYRVDRQKSVEVLKAFLAKKDAILETERRWLREVNAHAVLSDAAFLGCLAAKAAGIPSILITNFTFDSVYSYLSAPLIDKPSQSSDGHLTPASAQQPSFAELVPDVPIPIEELRPLVDQILAGYLCADLLFLLPGNIPIPSFSLYPSLPAQDWVSTTTHQLHPEVSQFLEKAPSSYSLIPKSPFKDSASKPRSVISAPLLVRSSDPAVYTREGRSQFLSSIGVPPQYHDPEKTKILIVSFGGQVFRAPSRSSSRMQSRSGTPHPSPKFRSRGSESPPSPPFLHLDSHSHHHSHDRHHHAHFTEEPAKHLNGIDLGPPIIRKPLVTPSHIWIPGAPPAHKSSSSQSSIQVPRVNAIPPTPLVNEDHSEDSASEEDECEDEAALLPDDSWIAIVCGVSKEQWAAQSEGLPDGFFVAPKDVYMPDLTAVGDVLLGKLGYGTVSECVDSCTPFVYVSRPLFIEEHGLKLYLQREGVGIELPRQSYEEGDWAQAVHQAWLQGDALKTKKRTESAAGIGTGRRGEEGAKMAKQVIDWTSNWWGHTLGHATRSQAVF